LGLTLVSRLFALPLHLKTMLAREPTMSKGVVRMAHTVIGPVRIARKAWVVRSVQFGMRVQFLESQMLSQFLETLLPFLVIPIFLLGFMLGYFVRAQISRRRRRWGSWEQRR
jgi:hypothetical protein